MRSWVIWLSLFLIAITIGWFWLLSHDLRFSRVEPSEIKPAAEQKTDDKKGK
ncbi:MAG: hypothetical protein K8R87_08145 [Verrucomicrobia bacterium]|nr:hypothetical protein [Verrucomicrobiota bacterium]